MSDVKPYEKYDIYDDLTIEIMTLAQRGPFKTAREHIARTLRELALRQREATMDAAQQAVRELFSEPERELQRECQADHDDAVANRDWVE
jgi:hypothetical protein